MTASHGTYGFPPGYFVLRSEAVNGRVLDVYGSKTADGALVGLWPEKEQSLVEVRRGPEAENQVFFIDDSGALCSRSSGHAIDIVEAGSQKALVLCHRKPSSVTGGRQLPRFRYEPSTGEITVHFTSNSLSASQVATRKDILTAVPLRKPRSIMDDASDLLASAVASPFGFFSGSNKSTATPEAVYGTDIEINDDEVLPEERGEEGEVDDSSDPARQVTVIQVKTSDDQYLLEQTRRRRQWRALPLRSADARTGAI